MRMFCSYGRGALALIAMLALAVSNANALADEPAPKRVYQNVLRPMANPQPLLADYPEFVAPIDDRERFEAPMLVQDPGADLKVRAWRYSYNARGIIEMPNALRADQTALIVVHPWGIDDGQGWRTPEPAGAADFCTVPKNHLAGRHTREVIDPLLKRLRGQVGFIMYSLPGPADSIRTRVYRSLDSNPDPQQRAEAERELASRLNAFRYEGEPLVKEFAVSTETPVIDYFRQFPGLDANPPYNPPGFWELPIPVTRDIEVHPEDIVIYDAEGYAKLRDFLQQHAVRHVLLAGYATDMCFCRTTAGYENLSRDFNVFLIGDATLATFPANSTPAHATNAHIAFAALNQLITQVSWIELDSDESP